MGGRIGEHKIRVTMATVFITGLAGSGKSTAASILHSMGFAVFEISSAIKEEMKSDRIELTPESIERYTMQAKRGRGRGFAAIATARRAAKAKGDVAVIGFRSKEELAAARRILGHAPLVLVTAPDHARRSRVRSRKTMRMGASELRMKDRSNMMMGMRAVMREADYILSNSGTERELRQNLKRVLALMNKG